MPPCVKREAKSRAKPDQSLYFFCRLVACSEETLWGKKRNLC